MTREDFINAIGKNVNRRYKDGKFTVCEVKNVNYANYYYELTKHGYEYQL